MRKLLLIALAAVALAFVTPRASAQTAMFVYTGVPAGPILPGSTFAIGVSLMVSGMSGPSGVGAPGVNDLFSVFYWFAQSSPTSGFRFSIINRDVSGSPFTDLHSLGLSYPQVMDPISRNSDGTTTSTDLGAALMMPPGQPNGTYFIANITFRVLPGATPGTYTLGNTTAATPGSGGRRSTWIDADGDSAFISASNFVVSVAPFAPSQVVSRKNHDGVPFDIDLPLTGNPGIECRPGGAISSYQVVFTFASPVTFTAAAVTTGVGTLSSTSGNGTTAVTLNLVNVNNAQKITVRLSGVSDGTNTGVFNVTMGVLVGDTNGDGVVNSGDAQQARNRSGQATDATNFRSDVNLDGFINTGDWIIVRARSGAFLP